MYHGYILPREPAWSPNQHVSTHTQSSCLATYDPLRPDGPEQSRSPSQCGHHESRFFHAHALPPKLLHALVHSPDILADFGWDDVKCEIREEGVEGVDESRSVM